MPKGIYARLSVLERFWSKVKMDGPVFKVELGPCWMWCGGIASKQEPYGLFSMSHTRAIRAHRFSYELIKGRIPDGLQLDHLCRNMTCVNPAHLEAVTSKENNARGYSPSAINKRKTHCANGHEFNKENTWIWPRNGRRVCLACGRERRRADAKRKRGIAPISKEGAGEHRARRT